MLIANTSFETQPRPVPGATENLLMAGKKTLHGPPLLSPR